MITGATEVRKPELVWKFGDFVLSAAAGLRRGDEFVKLESKTLEVLVHLIRHRDRVVGRDELLEAVWGDTVVEEAVLSQTIFKLRKQLGDPAREPQFILTYHRRGYQFIAEVETAPSTPSESKSLSGSLRPTTALAALILFAGVLGLAATFWPRADGDSSLPTLGFMPVTIEAEDPGAELIGHSFDDLLFKRLSEQPGLITRTRTLGSLQLAPLPDVTTQYAEEQRVDWVLRGRVSPALSSGRVWLEMELIRVGDEANQNFPLDRFELPLPGQPSDLEMLLAARDRVAAEIGDHVGIAVMGQVGSEGDPSSLESMRLLLLGLEELGRLRCGGELAVNHLQRAVEIDPQLTHAWVALGYAFYNEVWACGGDIAYLHRAYAMVERALELEPDSELARPLEAELLVNLGRPQDALMNLQTALVARPDSARLHYYGSFMLNYLGQLDQSEWHLERALQLDPFVLGTDVSDPPLVLLYRGRWREFLRRQVAVDSAYHRFYRGYALWQLGDQDQARAVLRPFDEQDWRAAPFVAYGQALLHVIEGQRAEAIAKIALTHERRRANGIRDGEMTFKEAWLMSLAGDENRAMDYLEATVEQGFTCSECIRNSPFVGLMTESPRFRSLMGRIQSSEQTWRRHIAQHSEPMSIEPD